MVQRDFIGKEVRLKQKGIFNVEEFYRLFHRWFELHGYSVYEVEYRDTQTPGGKLLKIKWHCQNDVDEYIRFVIRPSFLISGLEKVEAEKEGVKTMLHKADIEVKFNYFIEKDYDNKWSSGTALGRFIRDAYDKYFSPRRYESLRNVLIEEVRSLMEEMKAFLNMHRLSA